MIALAALVIGIHSRLVASYIEKGEFFELNPPKHDLKESTTDRFCSLHFRWLRFLPISNVAILD